MLIIPSKELLLITAQQSKEIFLFDPKTTSVLTKYHTESSVSKAVAYYPHANQFLTSYTNKTFINIWSTDSQQAINKVSTVDMITYLQITKDKNILIAGSQNGSIYFWQLPSGILIKKASIHSSQIKKIVQYKPGYLMTNSKNEIKIWSLASFYIQTQRSSPIKIINSVLDIIDVDFVRNLFIVLTNKSVTYYLAGNQHNPFPLINKEDISFPTKLCTSLTHLYVGDFQGSIHVSQIVTNQNSYQLNFNFNQNNHQIQVQKLNKKTLLKAQNKHPITCLVHLKTLPYLISGNTEGDINVWQNFSLKRSIKLFKTSIKFIFNIPKPMDQKIPQSRKIRPMAKYQQNKETQPLQVDIERLENERVYKNGSQQTFELQKQMEGMQQQLSNDLILQRMLQVLNRPQNILKGRISVLQEEKQRLVVDNLRFTEYLSSEKQLTSNCFNI